MEKLKKCKDCGHSISKSAESCPNCGARLKRRWYEIGTFTTIIVLVPLILGIAGQCSQT